MNFYYYIILRVELLCFFNIAALQFCRIRGADYFIYSHTWCLLVKNWLCINMRLLTLTISNLGSLIGMFVCFPLHFALINPKTVLRRPFTSFELLTQCVLFFSPSDSASRCLNKHIRSGIQCIKRSLKRECLY